MDDEEADKFKRDVLREKFNRVVAWAYQSDMDPDVIAAEIEFQRRVVCDDIMADEREDDDYD